MPEADGREHKNERDNCNEIDPERAEPRPEKSDGAKKVFWFGRHISDSDREWALIGDQSGSKAESGGAVGLRQMRDGVAN